ncbi:MGMT family protein [Arenimonas sp. GDDSR-1]|uniref:MGMT family protein n=1 Tax=Arenimonas sp. GDDSR-1 TaxID=2950125 RepID=UPI0026388627|nr:MGMT family protein [Arenimonas sp. GDDSR-1]
MSESRQDRILAVIRTLPHGSVWSYGTIAAKAGFPGCARLVARILSTSGAPDLPWHRVLLSSGKIAFPEGSPMFLEQAARLRAEGVAVRAGRVKMPKRGLDLDTLLWAPD